VRNVHQIIDLGLIPYRRGSQRSPVDRRVCTDLDVISDFETPNLRKLQIMVPRECSAGGKQKLLGISKRGNIYLRRLFVQGARSVLQYHHKQPPALAFWLKQLLARRHQNVVIVALANKLVRTASGVVHQSTISHHHCDDFVLKSFRDRDEGERMSIMARSH
jgi:hypothetical protein